MGIKGKIIINTAPQKAESSINRELLSKGADLREAPLISISQAKPDERDIDIFNGIEKYEWIVFTSANGVKHFFALAEELGTPTEKIQSIRFACYGSKTTAEIIKQGIIPSFDSNSETSDAFLKEFRKELKGCEGSVLLALGNLAGDGLQSGLQDIYITDRVDVYSTENVLSLDDEIIRLIKINNYDLLLFTSPSGFRNFIELSKKYDLGAEFKIACIGTTTAGEVNRLGYQPLLISNKPDAKSLADSIENYFITN